MKIIVCIKEVIDPALSLDCGLINKVVFREGLPLRLNPNDASALALSLGLRSPNEGVKDEKLPAKTDTIKTKLLKLNLYVSFKRMFWEKIKLDLSLYYQSKFKSLTDNPRIASSSEISYQLNDYISVGLVYQNIYDNKPVVPVDKWYHRIYYQLSATF